MCRCLKDKVPAGKYSILVSVLDRMGGSALDYKAEKLIKA